MRNKLFFIDQKERETTLAILNHLKTIVYNGDHQAFRNWLAEYDNDCSKAIENACHCITYTPVEGENNAFDDNA